MTEHSLTGTRIRERRMDGGIRQADLAATVGISPSYLNLIEHNKRRIGGKLLGDLARALGAEPAQLTQGADLVLLDKLRSAAASLGLTQDADRAEELATRYPVWAGVIAALADRALRLEAEVQTLTDRMAHDPQLAAALHDVISAVTSIRSTASILVGDDRIDAEWQRRFHQNIHDESRRLAADSEALIAYLEAPAPRSDTALSPAEACEAVLAAREYYFEELERTTPPAASYVQDKNDGPDTYDGPGKPVTAPSATQPLDPFIDPFIDSVGLGSELANTALRARLMDYRALAQIMPKPAFGAAAKDCDYDPVMLAARFGVTVAQVLRRLASLPANDGHPPMGLAVADAAGVITHYKAVPGFSLPRSGAACPLWPLYQVQAQPGCPVRRVVTLPDAAQSRLLCYAATEPAVQAGFDETPIYQATMLVIPDPPATPTKVQPVGITCRICPRRGCAARREQSTLVRDELGIKRAQG